MIPADCSICDYNDVLVGHKSQGSDYKDLMIGMCTNACYVAD